MKAIHVGILTIFRREYEEFVRDNQMLICTLIQHEYDLQRETFDYFIRLDGWKKLNPELLSTVRAIEKIRDIDKAPLSPDSSFNWRARINGNDLVSQLRGLGHNRAYFDELMSIPSHPMNRCNVLLSIDTNTINEAAKKSKEDFKKLSESWVGAGLSVKDVAKGLTILPDETIGTP